MSNRLALKTAARATLRREVSNGASWVEDFDITEDGAAVTDADTWAWEMTFYKCPGGSVDLTLSTSAGTLTVVQGSSATTMQVRAYTGLTNLCGDYLCDL